MSIHDRSLEPPDRIPFPPRARGIARDPIWLAYLFLLSTSAPVWMPLGAVRLARTATGPGRWERLGLGAALPENGRERCWLHGASVGEVQVLEPVVSELRVLRPDLEMTVTAMSEAGRARARELFGGWSDVRFAPLDLPWTVGAALRRIRPSILVLSESELWPSLLHGALQRGPVVLVNARISDRTFRRARKVRCLYRWMLGHLAAAGAQTEVDAGRLRSLGMPADRVTVTGNTKFDRETAMFDPAGRRRWRERLGLGEDPLLVAGSTFPGEEIVLAEALLRVRKRVPTARLLVAPRHVERAPEAVDVMRSRGLSVATGSDLRGGESPAAIVLDTMGELARLYSVAEIAFVGRSLVRGGGQNILEPLAAGVPVLHGPRMENFRRIADEAGATGAARTVSSVEDLARAWQELLLEPETRRELGERGRRLVEARKGASRRCAEMIAETLERAGKGISSPPTPASVPGWVLPDTGARYPQWRRSSSARYLQSRGRKG